MELSLYFSFITTLSIETWIYMGMNPKRKSILLMTMVMNAILNPLMNMLLVFGTRASYWISLWILEGIVILVEAITIHYLMTATWKKSLLFSILANGASLSVGLIFMVYRFSQTQLWIGSMLMVIPLVGLWTWLFFRPFLHQPKHQSK